MAGEQTASNILVAIKRETSTGVAPATVTGADQMRIISSPGLILNRGEIRSQEKRVDGNEPMGRLGGKSVEGSYNMEVTVGGAIDLLIEALMRSTWTASFDKSNTDFTSITATTNTIVAAGGSFITEGFKEGYVIRLSNVDDGSMDNINYRLTGVSASTLTLPAGSLTAFATADSAFTITVLKNVVANTAGPTRYSHAIEQYDQDIDLTELFLGCRVVSARFSFRPNQMAQVTFGFLGMDRTVYATGTSPFYTSPSLTTGLSLVADDSAIYMNGAAVTKLTGFDLSFDITAAGQPVIGSLTSPDIYDNDLRVSGTISALRQDFANVNLYDAETEFELGILLEENEAAPKDCLSIWLPRIVISNLNSPVGGGDGAKIETMRLFAGPAVGTSSLDATTAIFSSSSA